MYRRFNMKKIVLKFLMAITFLVMPLTLSSCNLGGGFLPQGDNEEENNNNNNNDKQVELILVDRSTVPEKIVAGQFFNIGIMLSVYYSDDSYERVRVAKSMVSPEDQVMLNQPGIHTIYIEYAAKRTSLTVTIVSQNESREITVNYYAYVETDEYVLVRTQQVEDVSTATAPAIHKQIYTDTLHYSFVSWQRQEESDTLINFYAQYRCSKYYTVNFYNYYGTIIKTQKIDEGNPATAPNMSLYPVDGYEFKGWDVEFNVVTTNLEVHPIYEEIPVVVPPEPEKYTITYYALPETGKFTINDYIVVGTVQVLDYETAVPPKVASECYSSTQHFTFTGWGSIQFIGSDSSHECNCFAQYDICNYYTVKFYNFSSEIISTQRIDEGASATAPDMSLYPVLGYDFKGWDVEFNNVTENLEIHPIYESMQNESITIDFWVPFGDIMSNALESQINDFVQIVKDNENVDVTVNLSSKGSYNNVHNSIINGMPYGDLPSIAVVYPEQVADYLYLEETDIGKYVVKLDDYMNDENYGFGKETYLEDGSIYDFIPKYLESGQYYNRDGTYSLPYMRSTEVMLYNYDAVETVLQFFKPELQGSKSKIENYMNNLDWEEFMELCRQVILYKNYVNPNLKTVAFYDSDSNMLISQMMQSNIGYSSIDYNGSGHIDFAEGEDRTKAEGLVTKLKGWYDENLETRLFTTKGTFSTYGSESFKNIESVFSICSTASLTYSLNTSFELGVCKVPPMDANNPTYVSQGPSLCLLRNPTLSDKQNDINIKYSWKLLKYLTNTENNCEICVHGSGVYFPIRTSSYEEDLYLEFLESDEMTVYVARAVLDYVDGKYFNLPHFYGASTLRAETGNILTLALTDNTKTITSIFDTAIQNALISL